MALRVIFMGTAKLSCASLKALLTSPDYKVIAVVTQPDKPKGRNLKLQPSPVKQLVAGLEMLLLQHPRSRNEDFVQKLRALQAELIVVAAYGQILPASILELPRLGCLNVHTSLLPKYRGAAPIQWAILNDESETGVTIMKMDTGMDTGPILSEARTPISATDTSETLHDRLAEMGAHLLVRTIPDYAEGRIQPRPQPAVGVSYAPKIKKEDGRLDWTQPARAVWNRARGLIPWPGAFAFLPSEGRLTLLKVWQAEPVTAQGAAGEILQVDKTGLLVACGSDALRIQTLQLEGGRRLTAQEFLAGHHLRPGQRLE